MHKENLAKDFEKNEIIEEINRISKKHGNLDEIKDILIVVSLNNDKSYIGNIKISDENKLEEMKKDLKELLNRYGNTSLKSEEFIPCCSPPYINIRFKINSSK